MAKPGFWVHGAPARNLEQIESYLTGDEYDRSKVDWFDGKNFHNLLETMRDAQRNYWVAENEGMHVGNYPELWLN